MGAPGDAKLIEPKRLEAILRDPEFATLRRKGAGIRWAMSVLAVFAYGSYCWLTGYRGEWFSSPVRVDSAISTGLAWMAGSVLLLVISEFLYEWYCRRHLDRLRASLAEKYAQERSVENEAGTHG